MLYRDGMGHIFQSCLIFVSLLWLFALALVTSFFLQLGVGTQRDRNE